MVDSHANGCLEPEVMAAYVDRGLSLAERARVETHLASCPQCIALVAGVARTVAELSAHQPVAAVVPEATPWLTRRALAGALAAAAAVIAVVAAPSLVGPWLDRDSGLVSLVESVGEQRSVLGRLTGGFPHAPLGAPSAGGQDGRAAGADRVLLTAGKIRESFGERTTPSRLHALGLSELLSGRYDDAALALQAASREQPANAQYLSDVAAVQLERARLGLRPDDLPRALAAADRARRLDPSLREAWFNRALAVTALSLTDQARSAWTEYLQRDSVSPWATEARARLAELAKPSPAEAWQAIEGRLQQTISPALADEAVRAQTSEARNILENEFADWADAVIGGGDGAGELQRLRVMSEAMLRVSGDALYKDAVQTIDRVDTADLERRRALARAHREYADAAAIFAQDQHAAAVPRLIAARQALAAIGSAYQWRAALDFGAASYFVGDAATAAPVIEDLVRQSQQSSYRYLNGRATWQQGLAAVQQGRLGEAQARYEDTLATFEGMGDVEQAAGAHGLLAALYYYLDDPSAEWEHRVKSLQALRFSRSHRFRHTILASAAGSLIASNPETALIVQDAVIENARAWGREAAVADAIGQRAAALAQLGRTEEAAATLAEARRHLDQVSDQQFKNRLEVALLATQSDLARRSDPSAAVEAAQRAIALVEGRRDRLRVAQLQLKLAQANIVWGRIGEAEGALSRGIQVFDEERRSLSDEGRISSRDESWGLFETSVHLAVKRNNLELAFAMAERGRARSLAEARKLPVDRSLSAIREGLAADEAIVALNQFEDELAIWVIRQNGAAVLTRPLSRADAQRLVARQQDEIWQQASNPSAGREIFNQIIRPAADRLAGVTRLIVVPDLTFENVSFASLWDQSKERFLVESLDVVGAPSANAYVTMSGARRVAAIGEPLVLAGRGNATETAARAISSAYAESRLLSGAAVTRESFFENASAHAVIHMTARTTASQAHPLLSRIVVADSPGVRHSGAILGSEIAAHTFERTGLVVLDETAADSHIRGEGTLSLARAFIAAGVPAVLGTLPGADEDAVRDLMIGFHRGMGKNISAAQALSTVQRNAIQQNGRRLGAWTALVLYGSDR